MTEAVRVDATPRAWPTVTALPARRIALLSIDFQADFVRADAWLGRIGVDTAPMTAVLGNAAEIITAARAAGVTIVHTRQGNAADLADLPEWRQYVRGLRNEPDQTRADVGLVRGEPGWGIVDEVAPIEGEIRIDKTGYSAFAGTDLHEQLQATNIEAVIIIGVTTNVCVLATLLAAVDNGYDALLITDAIAADKQAITEATLEIINHEASLFGARATTTALVQALSQ